MKTSLRFIHAAPPSALLLALLCSPAQAATPEEQAELTRLKLELQLLKQRYQAQAQTLQQLEQRLQRLSDGGLSPPSSAAAAANPAPPPGAGTDSAPAQQATTGDGASTTAPQQARSVESIYQEASGFVTGSNFSLEAGLTYTHYDTRELKLNGFLALDSIFLGNINLDRIKSDTLTLDLTGRYSLNDRWQFDANAPFLYRHSSYFSGGAGGAGPSLVDTTVNQAPMLGDISLGLSYRLLQENKDWPDVVWNFRVKAPTGKEPYGIKLKEVANSQGNLFAPESLPTGNGVWAASTGFSFVKTIDPAVVFANVGYTHNFTRHFRDLSTDPTQQQPGDVKLGDTIQYGLGLAFALNDRLSLGMSYSQSFTRASQIKYDSQPGSTSVLGSDSNAAAMNFGLTWVVDKHLTVVPNVAIGLTPDSPNFAFSLRFPYNF